MPAAAERSTIRTPDRRLRVFVSSTLGELAPERQAVREAVERLHLTPVMFELGARPHPPRALYRSYLEQSDVFVGIYWQRYGWVAPGEDLSGLEDEYRLAAALPQLIYIKDPAPGREPRLEQLLATIRDDDRVSYRRFSTPDELTKLVEDDLAMLLSERFLPSAEAPQASPAGTVTFLFTDIEGSTRLLRHTGARYGEWLDAHRRLLRSAFDKNEGREVGTEGDSSFVVFGRPGHAVAAAAEAQRALAAHPWPDQLPVRVRMGIHTGEATSVDGGYVGLEVHRAARIAAAAHGGQVVLSDATAALVRDNLPEGTRLRDLGEHRLKDFEHPERIHQLDVSGLPTDFPALNTLFRPSRLPVPVGSFVGRDRAVEAVARLLRGEGTRLVTLTGPGGIGKSRLALEVARAVGGDFPGGTMFVPLAALTDPSLVLVTIADRVGVRREAGLDLRQALADAVGATRTLVVLDNFEQVVAAATDVAVLVDRAPEAVLLVTSRQVLRVTGEQEYQVTPLAEPAAVRLFAERAVAARPGFRLTEDNAGAVTEICRRLDGLPLAIELAAARVRLLAPEALLARLSERLDVLGRGAVDLPERQRTLRATMDWSYGLLDDDEKALFAQLAVFAGGWTVQAAQAVCSREDEVDLLEALSGLVEKSLVVVADDAGPEPRLHMLETVRAYASEKLAALPDRADTERRHTEWMLTLARTLPGVSGLRTSGWRSSGSTTSGPTCGPPCAACSTPGISRARRASATCSAT